MPSIRLSPVLLCGAVLLGGCSTSREPVPLRPDGSGPDASGPDASGPDGSSPDASSPAADAAADARVALPSRCWPGTAAPCDCPSGPPGYHYCVELNVWGDCECAPAPMDGSDAGEPDAGGTETDAGSGSSGGDAGGSSGTGDAGTGGGHACTGDPEWCDGLDNDCDGVVDNGEPCPDSSVRHTLPYDGGVWLASWRADCAHRLQRVWPSVSTDVIDLPCGAEDPRFRPSDGALLYADDDGVYRYVASGPDVHVDDTPPCFDKRGYFDAEGNIYYQCDRTLRRNDGEVLSSSLEEEDRLRGILPPDRFVISNYATDTCRLTDSGGATLSAPSVEEWVGSMTFTAGDSPVVTRGDHAFVTYTRKYRAGTRHELVVFRVGGTDDVWRQVRRVPVDSVTYRRSLALPDGHVFQLRSGTDHRQWIRVYPPGEAPREIFDEDDDDNRSADRWSYLLPGPRAL